jgi:transcriptional regulator with XRE-family HTH domain
VVSNIENGKILAPKVATIVAIANGLTVSPTSLLPEINFRNPSAPASPKTDNVRDKLDDIAPTKDFMKMIRRHLARDNGANQYIWATFISALGLDSSDKNLFNVNLIEILEAKQYPTGATFSIADDHLAIDRSGSADDGVAARETSPKHSIRRPSERLKISFKSRRG